VTHRVVVVGGGPAGLAASRRAADAGAEVVLIDESPALGGPIARGAEADPRVRVRGGARVVAAAPGDLLIEDRDGAATVGYDRLVIATGARELFLPFPGWTLPGVFGAGGLQLLAKGGWPVAGKRVVLGGTGPLLLAAAAALRRLGAKIVAVAEHQGRSGLARFAAGLWRFPDKAVQALGLLRGRPRMWPSSIVRSAHGSDHVRAVTLRVGEDERTLPCDLLGVGFGLVPNLDLPAMLGCALEGGRVRADDRQATSVAGIFCAGEATGIGGIGKAIVEGEIAGLCAAGRDPEPALARRRRRAHAFAAALAKCFPPPAGWGDALDENTIVCRCEDVPWRALRDARDFRSAKLQTRCGMGACQGRVCGAALELLRGFPRDGIRPPLTPARLTTLVR
jgi:D-hydroxyproline dehydrogenase subunit alpha